MGWFIPKNALILISDHVNITHPPPKKKKTPQETAQKTPQETAQKRPQTHIRHFLSTPDTHYTFIIQLFVDATNTINQPVSTTQTFYTTYYKADTMYCIFTIHDLLLLFCRRSRTPDNTRSFPTSAAAPHERPQTIQGRSLPLRPPPKSDPKQYKVVHPLRGEMRTSGRTLY